MVSTTGGAIAWAFLKPMLMGQILFTPDTPVTRAIMEKVLSHMLYGSYSIWYTSIHIWAHTEWQSYNIFKANIFNIPHKSKSFSLHFQSLLDFKLVTFYFKKKKKMLYMLLPLASSKYEIQSPTEDAYICMHHHLLQWFYFEQVWLCFSYTASFTNSTRHTKTNTAGCEIFLIPSFFTCSRPCPVLAQANATLQEFADLRKNSEEWIETSNYIVESSKILGNTLPMLQVWRQNFILCIWIL